MKKTVLAAALVLAAGTATAATQTKAGATINLDKQKLSKAEFQALPDAQTIVFKGQALTAGNARLKLDAATEHVHSLAKSAGLQLAPKIAAARKTFLDTQNSALASRNAQGLAAYEQRFHSAAMAPMLKR
jgi:hypothetical protein